MSLGEILRARRESFDMTQDQVVVKVGISKPYLSNIETGKAPNPPSDEILKALEKVLKFQTGELLAIAHRTKTPVDIQDDIEGLEQKVQLLRKALKDILEKGPRLESGLVDLSLIKELNEPSNVRLSPGKRIPIINGVSAGYPAYFTDLDYPASVADEYVHCPNVHDSQAFAARIVGDSMEPDFHEGDIVVFSPRTEPRDGDDCFVRFEADGGTTFKRYYKDGENSIRLQPLNNKYPSAVYAPEIITGLWPAVYRVQKVGNR
jgi:repressor LexA